MQTYTGRQFWPLDPRPEEIYIEDIAHALSNLCRYAGHCKQFYSVAEHSVLVSMVCPTLTALLHDATEAYIVDLPRPFKNYLNEYNNAEQKIWIAVVKRFNLPLEIPQEVHIADNSVLLAEKEQIMEKSPVSWSISGEPADVGVQCLTPFAAKFAFMKRYKELTEQREQLELLNRE